MESMPPRGATEQERTTEIPAPLLDVLARLNRIGEAISRMGTGDEARLEDILRLIVESAVKVVPDASAIIYAYDTSTDHFDVNSRVAAGRQSTPLPGDEPRRDGMGARALRERRRILSYEETDLDIHPVKKEAGARVIACFPLVTASTPLGVLYVYLHEERPFTQLELLMLENFVNQAAIAMYHAQRLAGVRRDLERKKEELRRLRHAGLLISSRWRLQDTLETILQMALEVTGARYGILRLVDETGENLVTRAIAGERLSRPAVESLPINATSITGWAAKYRQPLCIRDVRESPWSRIYYPLDYDLEMRSELAVPLVGANGRLEGVVNLESPQVGAFSEEDSYLLQTLATQAVIAIQEARLLDALQEIAWRLLTEPLDQVFARVADLAQSLLNAATSAIWTLEGDHLVLQAAGAGHTPGERLPVHNSLTGLSILRRKAITSPNVQEDSRFHHPDLAREHGWGAALIVPMLVGDEREPVGTISVYWPHDHPRRSPLPSSDPGAAPAVSDWDRKVLTILAHYAALAVHNARHREALQQVQEQRAVAETFAALGDIAANVLHQLNNKVGTIPVRVQGIEDKYQDILSAYPYLAENLNAIERSAREALDALRDSLSLLHPLHRAAVSVAHCVHDAIQAADLPPNARVHIQGIEDLPPVMADRRSLTFVFVNLLQNAAEAMNGEGLIHIAGDIRDENVVIKVTDTGPGIPPEVQHRIFDFDFSRREEGRQHRLGFGLWWVKTLMVRLGGRVSVESDGSRGSTFVLWLPIAQEGSGKERGLT